MELTVISVTVPGLFGSHLLEINFSFKISVYLFVYLFYILSSCLSP